jgi:hypothetical protein
MLPKGEERGLRGEAPGEPGVRGTASSGPSVGPEPLLTALPQEGRKRAAPGTSLPQAGQLMAGAGVYLALEGCKIPEKDFLNPSPPMRHDVLTTLLVQDNSEKRLVDLHFAAVLDEAQLSKLVHEQIYL